MRPRLLRAIFLAVFSVIYSSHIMVAAPSSTHIAAPDENKFKALIQAAQASAQAKNYQNAIGLYDSARKLTSITATQKAAAQFGYASALHKDASVNGKPLSAVPAIQAEYEAALRSPQLPEGLRIQAHEAVGDLLILRGQRMSAIREYQKALAFPSAGTPAVQQHFLRRMFAELQKVAPSSEALSLAETTFAQLVTRQESPAQKAAVKDDFAQILVLQNQNARAIALWNELTDDKALPVAARVEVLRKVGAMQRRTKNWPEAFQTADKLITLFGATPQQIPDLTAWRSRERAAIFQAQGDESKAREEWKTMLAWPHTTPKEKALLWMDIADSYGREMAATQKNDLLPARKQAYETAWNTEGARPELRVQALLDRGQTELDAKNPGGAIELLNEGLKKVQSWDSADEAALAKRAFHLALAEIHRSEKKYDNALSALISAQQSSRNNDAQILQAAMNLSQNAFAARQWPAARKILMELQNIWRIPRKVFLLNLIEIEIAEQRWGEARKALGEIETLSLTSGEKTAVQQLRAQIPVS
jgi:hypothetical protein